MKIAREKGASSADNLRFRTPERAAKSARLDWNLRRPHSKAVTEERLAGVLVARKRRKEAQAKCVALKACPSGR